MSSNINKLDKRLSVCAELVTGKRVCDVGTDHAYLVAELLSDGKCDSAVACDINEGPLKSARATLVKYGVSDKTDIILSNGLKNVPSKDITDIVIAGMGAELISNIISACEWIKNDINLILQPMTHAPFLRKWLCENGFKIEKEVAVSDGDMFYTIINTRYTGVKTNIDELHYNVGFCDKSLPASKEYINKQYERVYKVGKSLSDAGKTVEAKPYLLLAENIISYMKG